MSEKSKRRAEIEAAERELSVCKTAREPKINPAAALCFTDRTDEVCQTDDVPAGTTEREEG